MNLKFKNSEIKAFGELIGSLTLKGKESRWRTKLFELVANHYNQQVNPQLIALADDFAIRDEKGEYIYVDKNKQAIEVDMKYYEEERILLNEELIIECNESNKIMILTNAKIMLDGDFDVKPEIAPLYDSWCERFEEIITYYEENESK